MGQNSWHGICWYDTPPHRHFVYKKAPRWFFYYEQRCRSKSGYFGGIRTQILSPRSKILLKSVTIERHYIVNRLNWRKKSQIWIRLDCFIFNRGLDPEVSYGRGYKRHKCFILFLYWWCTETLAGSELYISLVIQFIHDLNMVDIYQTNLFCYGMYER